MPFNGSGGYSPPGAPDYPAVSGDTIYADRFNNVIDDIAAALGAVICRDGQSNPTANLPMNSFKHTGATAASGAGEYLTYNQDNAQLTKLGIGAAPLSTTQLYIRAGTDHNFAVQSHATTGLLTIYGLTNAGASAPFRVSGLPLTFSGNGGAGAEHVRIDNAGNIGINRTPASNVKVDILGVNNSTGYAANSDMRISSANQLVSTVYSWNQIAAAGGDFRLGTEGTERLTLKTTGQLRFVPLSSDPSNAEDGDVYYNSSTNKLRVRANGVWTNLH